MNAHGSSEVPKVADFLGVSKSENQSDLVGLNEIQANDSDYLFQNKSLVPVENIAVVAATSNNYEFQEKANSLQSLTLSMGSGKGSSASETSGDNSANTVEATPRRTLDTFGQTTSIYRGVTRLASIHDIMQCFFVLNLN